LALLAFLLGWRLGACRASADSVVSDLVYTNQHLTVGIRTDPTSYYSLWAGTSLTSAFAPVAMTLPSSLMNGRREFTVPAGSAEGYFQIRSQLLTQPDDTDRDGIDDAYELQNADRLGLNPLDGTDGGKVGIYGVTLLEQYQREKAGQTAEPGSAWPRIFAGPDYAFALLENGTLLGWGTNKLGQLGDGTNVTRLLPQRIGLTNRWQNLSIQPVLRDASGTGLTVHEMGVQADGRIWQWTAGGSENGKVSTLVSGTNWATVAVAQTHTLALDRDGALWAWGANRFGQMGVVTNIKDLDTTNLLFLDALSTSIPQRVGTNRDWVSISANGVVSAGIRQDGSLWMWGQNYGGELGLGDRRLRPSPRQVGTNQWTEVIIGSVPAVKASSQSNVSFVIGRQHDGTLWAWGGNRFGQVGDGTQEDRLTPVRISNRKDWAGIASSTGEVFAWNVWGDLYAWGTNNIAANGITSGSPVYLPTQVGNLPPVNAAVAGFGWMLVRTKDGRVLGVGRGEVGQLANNMADTRTEPTPILLEARKRRLAVGDGHNLSIRPDGSLWAWGRNEHGQLGIGGFEDHETPVRVGEGTNWVEVVAKGNHSAGITREGEILVWGDNEVQQLTPGNLDAIDHPIPVEGLAGRFTHLATSDYHNLARRDDGTAWMFGDLSKKAFATNFDQVLPGDHQFGVRQIGTRRDWFSLFGAANGSAGIASDGKAYGWGYLPNPGLTTWPSSQEFFRAVADPPINNTPFGGAIATQGVVEILFDSYYVLSIDGSGGAWIVGAPYDTHFDFHNPPRQPTAIADVNRWIAASGIYLGGYLGLRTDGTVRAAGRFYNGELGLGTEVGGSYPALTTIAPSHQWVEIATGIRHVTAEDKEHHVYQWGTAPFGPLVLGFTPANPPNHWKGMAFDLGNAAISLDGSLWVRTNPSPAFVSFDTNRVWSHLSGGLGGLLAVAVDGSLWGSGWNYADILGTGESDVEVQKLTKIGSASWRMVQVSQSVSAGIQVDGSLWVWGGSGQQWISSADAPKVPTQFGTDKDWASLSMLGVHGLLLKQDGSLWGGGDNSGGVLDTSGAPSLPLHLIDSNPWKAVSTGRFHSLGIRPNGTLWIWGHLASGTFTNGIPPTQVGKDTDWVSVASGPGWAAAIREDRSLWVWGNLRPDGRTEFSAVPIRVPGSHRWLSVMSSANNGAIFALDEDYLLWGLGPNFGFVLDVGNPIVTQPQRVHFGD
jgi:alpha-tubulin suppressor-like RCC1 family protein